MQRNRIANLETCENQMNVVVQTELKPNTPVGSGRVCRFDLPDGKSRITQITTFCPDEIGPGPAHVYLIETDVLVMLDAGMPTYLAKAFFYEWISQPEPKEVEKLSPDHSRDELLEGFALAGYAISDVDLLVISHGHLDHFLMARSILADARARVSAHILDTPSICNPWSLLSAWVSRRNQIRAIGMPSPWSSSNPVREEMVLGFDPNSMDLALQVDAPIFRDGPLALNGTPVRDVEVLHLPGHSPGSVGLMVGSGKNRVLLCGDVLLSPITPHPDELLVYLQTLSELGELDDVSLVLPAHGELIPDLPARVAFLEEHHRRRLRMTYDACVKPQTIWDIAAMQGYFETYVDPGKFNLLAGQEALVHVELLNMVQGLRRTGIKNHVHYFQNTGEPFDEVYGRVMEVVTERKAASIMRY